MTRTDRSKPTNSNSKQPKNANKASNKLSHLSRSLSKLLRHQAENEKVPITAAGWVKLDDLLAWKGLERIGQGITVEDIFEVVEEDGRTGKGRFAVQFLSDDGQIDGVKRGADGISDPSTAGDVTVDGAATGSLVEATSSISITDTQSQPSSNIIDPASKNTPETQLALHHHTMHPKTPATQYLIRANQGHSISTIESSSLLTPLTLTTPSLPTTVVHGTFYASYQLILASGGLKAMGRNNIHFATGPPLSEVLDSKLQSKSKVDDVLNRHKVISGMRWDAQVLIYIDLKRCLEDVAENRLDMTWWVSGNGVVLTEGVTCPVSRGGGQGEEKLVPMKYWDCVVEIKAGLGVLWRQGEGVVQELPQRLKEVPLPRGKGRVHGSGGAGNRGRGRGRGGRERGGEMRLNVDKNGMASVDYEDDDNSRVGGDVDGDQTR